ncbi:MAG TPA: sensor domain-containing diguanylate cyclase [Ilumatobacteraceae bacterium]|nr:sensor domain-containing diguanylate cyclase [Ilumatobacteraceae bacterium]
MALAESDGFVLAVAERLAFVGDLLAGNPTCAVGVFDPARTITDAGAALARVGITVDGHACLKAGALAEFVALSDIGVMTDAALEANARGSAKRALRLRDGQLADLYLVEISDAERTTVAIIVPSAGEMVAATPPPTAFVASPRVGVVKCDAFSAITSVSDSTLVLLGRPNEPIEGMSAMQLLHPDDQEMALVNWLAAKEQRGIALRWRCRLARADGSSLWTEVTITNNIKLDGTGDVHLNLHDISSEVAATDALVAERELIALLTETLPVGVAKFDAAGRVEHSNGRLTELLAPIDPSDLLRAAVRGELEDPVLAAAFRALLRDGVTSRFVVDHHEGDGRDDGGAVRHLEWTIRAAVGDNGEVTGGVVCVADVTEAAQLREALEDRARTDALTGCLNRAGTITALEHALASLGPSEGVGLFFIDLDGFKVINDSRGHAVGDAVLEIVAGRLRGSLGPGDLVGRLGGDEFVVISPGLESASAAFDLAGIVSRQLRGPAFIADVAAPIAASIGVAWSSTATASELLGAADAAMYIAKQTRSEIPVLARA